MPILNKQIKKAFRMKTTIFSFCLLINMLVVTGCTQTVTTNTLSDNDGGYSHDYAGSTGYGADYIYSSSYYGSRPYWVNRFSASPNTEIGNPSIKPAI